MKRNQKLDQPTLEERVLKAKLARLVSLYKELHWLNVAIGVVNPDAITSVRDMLEDVYGEHSGGRVISEDAYPDIRTRLKDSGMKEDRIPKMDRRTRGQVRRVTNKLNTIERGEFPSSSNPNRRYEARVYTNGKVLCNCQGWTMKKGEKPRQCKHTKELIRGRKLIEDGEFQYIEEIATKYKATLCAEEAE